MEKRTHEQASDSCESQSSLKMQQYSSFMTDSDVMKS